MDRRAFISLMVVFCAGFASKASPEPALSVACDLKAGELFSFRTTSTSGGSATVSYDTDRGLAVIPPLPIQQAVRVAREVQQDGHPCVILDVERTLPSFVPGSSSQSCSERITARIDKSNGVVFDVVTATTIDGSVSRSTQRVLSGDSTLADFYGSWMLDLRDGYNRSNTSQRGTVTSLVVTGRAKVQGRECFVVNQTLAPASGQKVATTFWVDTHRRVAVRASRGGSQMQLVK